MAGRRANVANFFPIFKLTRLPEGLARFQKKGKSSEFNQKNYDEVKSSPAVKVWLRDSVKVGVKFVKWVHIRVSKNMFFFGWKGSKLTF